MHLAQINIGRIRYPLEDPRMADFVDNLDVVNALAEGSPGFVWRLQDEIGNATHIQAFEDPRVIVNMSVWTSVEALEGFAYRTMHRRFVQRRKEWFELFGAPSMALWWIEKGVIPYVGEGKRRLRHLDRFGPTAYAFSFKRRFPASPAEPLGPIDDDGAAREAHRSCG